MTYLQFHLVFIIPPMLLMLARLRGAPAVFGARAYWTLPAVCVIALVYTTPWDNYLVYRGVWGYGNGRVIGTIGYVPVEEYMFFVLQPLLVGAWAMRVMMRSRAAEVTAPTAVPSAAPLLNMARVAGALVYAALAVAGGLLLRSEPGLYLGLILAWAAPVLGAQWVLVARSVMSAPFTMGRMMLLPTLYLWVADRIAIGLGIWHIAPEYTTGLHLLGLPVEEALFFLVTNLLVVQAVILFLQRPAQMTPTPIDTTVSA